MALAEFVGVAIVNEGPDVGRDVVVAAAGFKAPGVVAELAQHPDGDAEAAADVENADALPVAISEMLLDEPREKAAGKALRSQMLPLRQRMVYPVVRGGPVSVGQWVRLLWRLVRMRGKPLPPIGGGHVPATPSYFTKRLL